MKKKLLAAILAATMVMGMNVTAFAAEDEPIDTRGEYDQELIANIMTDGGGDIYAVDLTWSDMEFEVIRGAWDPATHQYAVDLGAASPSVKIQNHSNADVRVSFTATPTDPNYNLELLLNSQDSTGFTTTDTTSYLLESAVGKTLEETATVACDILFDADAVANAIITTDESMLSLGTITAVIDDNSIK